jgi:AraC family transcriptional activator of tynA and feaB
MSQIEIVSIERHNCRGSVPEWTDALSTCLGRLPLSSFDQELTSCVPTGQKFSGRIEFGSLGDIVLAKIETSTPHHLAFSLRTTSLTVPAPLVLIFQMSGSCRLEQHNRSCALCPGDWSVVDTRHPFHIWSLARRNENLSLRLERPSDPELLSLLPGGAAHCWHGTTGASRILQATLRETFSQMGCLLHVSETGLQRAVAKMVWSALQEQLEAPPLLAHQDVRRARIKSFIELRLEDPDLSVESVAQTCGVSVRSLHRAFAADPAGSVSKYIWVRRLGHCAADLRDPTQAHRPVTEICFSWGFNSTSHFSRLFKDQFGVSPSEYRTTS